MGCHELFTSALSCRLQKTLYIDVRNLELTSQAKRLAAQASGQELQVSMEDIDWDGAYVRTDHRHAVHGIGNATTTPMPTRLAFLCFRIFVLEGGG